MMNCLVIVVFGYAVIVVMLWAYAFSSVAYSAKTTLLEH